MTNNTGEQHRNKNFVTALTHDEVAPRPRNHWFGVLFLVLFAAGLCWAYVLTMPPRNFVPNTLISIPSGYSLQSIGRLLEEKSIIRSSAYFSLAVAYEGKEKQVSSGMYLFKDAQPVFAVAHRFASGDHGIETIKVTIPEGYTIKDISKLMSSELPQFNAESFLNDANDLEGFLFPDTYNFYSTATSGPIISVLAENFEKKTAPLKIEALLQKKGWNDVVTMASLIEGEAVTPLDRRIVSQILWKRLAIKMKLQVDAPFVYIMNKGSLQLSMDDLNIDSPYNTYRYYGLPPTPINNPGIDTIDAALHPATTTYLYYLSDKGGVMHYARTFDAHKLNKAKYIR